MYAEFNLKLKFEKDKKVTFLRCQNQFLPALKGNIIRENEY
jgi:hypothetical protein